MNAFGPASSPEDETKSYCRDGLKASVRGELSGGRECDRYGNGFEL